MNGITIEVFDTEAEALAFIDGLEYAINLEYDEPMQTADGKFTVEVRAF